MRETGAWTALAGATRYEFGMQIRRKALWVVFATFALPTVFGAAWTPYTGVPEGFSVTYVVISWSLVVQFLLPIAFGCLLADRLPRDRDTRMEELLGTLPAPVGIRLLGKYLGATLATLVPVVLIWAPGVACVAVESGDPWVLALGVLAFATVNLPGLLFVGAFSVACPVVLWVPLYQLLYVGYWFWGNLIPTSPTGGNLIPSLSHTILTPFGEYMASGFFGTGQTTVRATASEGMASMGLLLGLGALALLCAYALLRRKEAAA